MLGRRRRNRRFTTLSLGATFYLSVSGYSRPQRSAPLNVRRTSRVPDGVHVRTADPHPTAGDLPTSSLSENFIACSVTQSEGEVNPDRLVRGPIVRDHAW